MRSAAPFARSRRAAGAWVPAARPTRSSGWRRRFRLRIRADVMLVVLMVAASLLGTAWAATSPGSPRVGIVLGVVAFVGLCVTLLLFGWTMMRARALARLSGSGRPDDGARRIEEHGRLFAGWFAAHQLLWLTLGLLLATPLLLPRGASSDLILATVGGLLTVAACGLAGALSAARPLLSSQGAALAACWLSPIPHDVRSVRGRAEALLLLPTRLVQVRAWDAGQPQPLLRKIVQVREAARLGRAGFVLDIRRASGVSWRRELVQRAAVYGVIWLFGALVALLALRAGLIAPLVPALTSITAAEPCAATPTPGAQATPTPNPDGGSDAPQQGEGPGQGGSQGAGSGTGGSATDGAGQGDGSGSGEGGGQSQGSGEGQGQGQGAGEGDGQGDGSGQGQGPGTGQGQGQETGQGQATGQQGQGAGQGSGQGQGAGQGSGQQQGQSGSDGPNQQGQGAGQSGDGQQSGQGQSQGQQDAGQQAQGQEGSQGQPPQAQAGGGVSSGEGNGGGGQQGDQQPGAGAQQGPSQGNDQGSGNTGSGAGGGPGASSNRDQNTPPTPPQLGAPTPVQIPSAKSTDDIVSIDLPAIGPGQQAEGTPQPVPGTPLPVQPGQAGPQGPNASGTASQGSRSAGQPLPSWIQSLLDGAGAP